jgi:glutathione S-transferase
MTYVDIVTALALLQYLLFGWKVGSARERYGVRAPAVSGHEIFERRFRVQQNTLEQLIAFLPGLYLFARYWHPVWGAAIGVVYLLGRELYSAAYVRDPSKRGTGFGLSFVAVAVLVLGGLCGAVRTLF